MACYAPLPMNTPNRANRRVHFFSAFCMAATLGLLWVLPIQAVTNGMPTVTRGPYLQQGGTTNVIVRWRTDVRTDSLVRYGASPGNLNQIASDAMATTDHEVRMTGLSPNTKYFYSVGTTDGMLAGDESFF